MIVQGLRCPLVVNPGQHSEPSGDILRVPFASSRAIGLPVEVVTRSEIEARLGPAHLGRPELVEFHLMIVPVERGGHHLVDFHPVPVAPDRIVVIRPGQVMAWDASHRSDAIAVLARPWVLDRAWHPGDPSSAVLDDHERAAALDLVGVLQREQDRYDGSSLSDRVLTSVFAALHALAERALAASSAMTRDGPAAAFQRAIEDRIAAATMVHNVAELTTPLPWSTRTIARSTASTLGLTPKQVLDRRLLLEAQRRLAHSDASVAAIARSLGFADRTNFHRFFMRVGSESPTSFRERHR